MRRAPSELSLENASRRSAAVDLVALPAAGADHELRHAVDDLEALEVVVVAAEQEPGAPAQLLPDRVDVALLAAMLAGVEARAVHERDHAGARGAGELAAQEAQLRPRRPASRC